MRPPPSIRVALTFLLLAFPCGLGVGAAWAASAGSPEEVFELLFKLGLPDTKGAKWVKVESGEMWQRRNPDGLLEAPGGQYSGNAWLLHEGPGGMLEYLEGQTRVSQGRRTKEPDKEMPLRSGRAGIPETRSVTCSPANLDADLAHLAKALKEKPSAPSTSPLPGQYADASSAESTAATLLFLAHAHREGHTKAADSLLPLLLARSLPPEETLQTAVEMIADARLAKLNDEWVHGSKPATYAASLEALAGDFGRTWKRHQAVLALATRAREQKPGKDGNDPKVQAVATLLLKTTSAGAPARRTARNWLLPEEDHSKEKPAAPQAPGVGPGGGDDAEEDSVMAEADEMESGSGDSSPGSEDATGRGGNPPTPFAALLAGKRETAVILARLLDDHRLIRALDSSSEGFSSFTYRISSSDDDDEASVERELKALPKPLDVGALAMRLLQPVLPKNLQRDYGDEAADRPAAILAWFREVAPLTDEELAWRYLRSGTDTSDLLEPLRFLIAHGSDATMGKLRDVFLDPAVWKSDFGGKLPPLLTRYLERTGTDSAAFRGEVMKLAEASVKEEFRNVSTGNAEMRKMLQQQSDAKLAVLRQALNPRGLKELLAEFGKKKGAEAAPLLPAIAAELKKSPLPAAESQIYEAAAQAEEPAIRGGLVTALLRAEASASQARKGVALPDPAAADAEAAKALEKLLQDETVDQTQWRSPLMGPQMSVGSVADLTAECVVWSRSSNADVQRWQKLMTLAPHLAPGWLKEDARAMAAGHPLPPLPPEKKLPPARVTALIEELGAQPAGAGGQALRKKTREEQLAIVEELATRASWPAGLLKEQLTIQRVETGPNLGFPLDPTLWKGRMVDSGLIHDLEALGQKEALEGHSVECVLSPPGALSGVTLTLLKSESMPPEALTQLAVPGLTERPTPDAFSSCRFVPPHPKADESDAAGFARPLWKNAEENEAWRKAIGDGPKAASENGDVREKLFSPDRRAFDQRVQALHEGSAEAHGPFVVDIGCFPVQSSAQRSESITID